MRKLVLFVLALVLALGVSFPMEAATTRGFTCSIVDDPDEEKNEFGSIADALDAAADAEEEYSEVTITLSTSLNVEEIIDLTTDYSFTSVTIKGGSPRPTIKFEGSEDEASKIFSINASGFTLNLSGLNIEGGGINLAAGTLAAENVTFRNCTLTGYDDDTGEELTDGGVISLSGAGTATFTSCTFTGNKATNGGAVSLTGRSSATFTSCTFTGNEATHGGAVYVTGTGTATFASCNFTNKNSAQNGGAVYVTETGSSSFSGSYTFSENSAEENGGAIYAAASGTVSVEGGANFEKNSAKNGGAVYLTEKSSASFGGSCTFSENTATESGGAIYAATSGTVSIESGANFETNSAKNGGAVYINDGCTLSMSGTVNFDGNTATENGGAICVNGTGMLTDKDATLTFTNNRAAAASTQLSTTKNDSAPSGSTGFGGAICFNNSSTSAVSELGTAAFDGNKAYFGGAVANIGTGTVNFSKTASFGASTLNTAYSGGALYISSGTVSFAEAATFTNNEANDHGGAVYAGSGTTALEFKGAVTFTGNKGNNDKGTLGDGGAIWWGLSPADFTGAFQSSATFTNNQTSGGTSTTTAGNGGAVFIASSGTETITLSSGTSFSFSGNTAYKNGGALYANSANVVIDSQTILTNTATNGAGGFLYTLGTVDVTKSEISGDVALYGGAIYAGRNVTVDNSTFLGNKSTGGNSSAELNTGGGAIFSAADVKITNKSVFQNNTSNGNYQNQGGGAVFSTGKFEAQDSVFDGNVHTNTTGQLSNGGGAVYVLGDIEITGCSFTSNYVNAGGVGGAIYSQGAQTVQMTDNYFANNFAEEHGGALYIVECATMTLNQATFSGNTAKKGAGGAVWAKPQTFNIASCYFENNKSVESSAGALYYSQHGDLRNPSTLTLEKSEFAGNSASKGYGGAAYIDSDGAEISQCTFSTNTALNQNDEARGGAICFSIQDSAKLINSTFVKNQALGDTKKGGAIYISGTVSVILCTFALHNEAIADSDKGKGGAIYVESNSNLEIQASIVVGNDAYLGNDIFADGSVRSNGNNRIGIFGQGSSNSNWTIGGPGVASDSANESWTNDVFFGTNELDINPSLSDPANCPPNVGSSGNSERLHTLMISEKATLELKSRAMDAIDNRYINILSTVDQRGVKRPQPDGGNIDIGALEVEQSGSGGGGEGGNTSLNIASITMSGIPNTLKSLGTTASLIAVIRYENGTTAYGGTADGCEPVTWSSDKKSVVYIHPTLGNIVARSYGTATISVRTNRTMPDGQPATASRVVRVDQDATIMNSVSSEFINYLSSYIGSIPPEHDLSISLADLSESIVKSSTFQQNFKSVWNVANVGMVSELKTSTPTFTTSRAYRSSGGFVASKGAGVEIDFKDRAAGDIFPLTYSWNFSSAQLKAALGSDLSDVHNDNAAVKKLFTALRIDYQTASNSWPVVGSGGLDATEALQHGVLKYTAADGNKGAHLELTAYLANVPTTGDSDGPQFVKGGGTNWLLVVPDGVDDGAITGTMWMVQGSSTAQQDTSGTPNTQTTPDNTEGQGESSDGGGGGGGCASFSLGLLGLALLFRRR